MHRASFFCLSFPLRRFRASASSEFAFLLCVERDGLSCYFFAGVFPLTDNSSTFLRLFTSTHRLSLRLDPARSPCHPPRIRRPIEGRVLSVRRDQRVQRGPYLQFLDDPCAAGVLFPSVLRFRRPWGDFLSRWAKPSVFRFMHGDFFFTSGRSFFFLALLSRACCSSTSLLVRSPKN